MISVSGTVSQPGMASVKTVRPTRLKYRGATAGRSGKRPPAVGSREHSIDGIIPNAGRRHNRMLRSHIFYQEFA